MAEIVINNDEGRLEIAPLLDTVRDGVTALETASSMIHIPTREMSKIRTAMKKMREAAVYIENRAHNLSVKSPTPNKTAVRELLKGATQEQIDQTYAILSGQEAVEDETDQEEAYLTPVEWDEG